MFGGNNTAGVARLRLATVVATMFSVGLVATGCTTAPVPTADKAEPHATVVRVIDGDTIVADVSGTEETIRLLNLDTPETKDPSVPVECLGPEATEFMESLLNPGDEIDLEYDVQRLDAYGRTLAGVYKDGSLVNADIAAAGLGVAVTYPPNERFYAEVKAAEAMAQKAAEGLFSPDVACTVPAMATAVIDDLENLEPADPGSSASAGKALAVVSAAVVAGKAKRAGLKALNTADDGVRGAVWATSKGRYLPGVDSALEGARTLETQLTKDLSVLAKKEKAERLAKAEAKKKAEARQKAIVAEQQAAARRKAAATKRYVAPKKSYRAPAQPRKRSTGGGSYSGYNGPRCYAPGGKSWRPC
ncbi:thermonuclease family protein [Paeniglutamicibacter cryotolerans]|uniref:Micrococcal nuclease n=1 Tax=Paeniglutamicibacter cryotolerans TaxID=670079 RepID=A0A839QG31_9MICC|nr:thermonuclease family protein [Paeniglutamicibacter cryotolerans]MBB2994637.1 micrococcal nuclease [Paeniglutamicibacter cryotolerans]